MIQVFVNLVVLVSLAYSVYGINCLHRRLSRMEKVLAKIVSERPDAVTILAGALEDLR
jgi:hypothetical protein